MFTDALTAACLYSVNVSETSEVEFVIPNELCDQPKVPVRTTSVN